MKASMPECSDVEVNQCVVGENILMQLRKNRCSVGKAFNMSAIV